MEYTIKKPSAMQQFFYKAKSNIENIFITMIMVIASITKSKKLSAWLNRYTQKKIQKMQSEIIRMKWDKLTLNKALDSIHENPHNT